jgi:hypothetical protein
MALGKKGLDRGCFTEFEDQRDACACTRSTLRVDKFMRNGIPFLNATRDGRGRGHGKQSDHVREGSGETCRLLAHAGLDDPSHLYIGSLRPTSFLLDQVTHPFIAGEPHRRRQTYISRLS